MPVMLLLLTLNLAFADPLLNAIFGIYPYQVAPASLPTTPAPENTYNDEYQSETGAEPEHYSWDNLYLCQFCDTEIIIDPYGNNNGGNEDAYFYY